MFFANAMMMVVCCWSNRWLMHAPQSSAHIRSTSTKFAQQRSYFFDFFDFFEPKEAAQHNELRWALSLRLRRWIKDDVASVWSRLITWKLVSSKTRFNKLVFLIYFSNSLLFIANNPIRSIQKWLWLRFATDDGNWTVTIDSLRNDSWANIDQIYIRESIMFSNNIFN